MLKKLIRYYNRLEENVLILSLVFTVALIFLQVIMRKVFQNSITWSEELARYIFIWQIWLGTSIGFRDGKHISISVVRDHLKGKGLLVYDIISQLILIGFCVFLAVQGWTMCSQLMATNYLSAALRMPMWLLYLALPFSSLAVICRVVAKLIREIRQGGIQPPPQQVGEGEA